MGPFLGFDSIRGEPGKWKMKKKRPSDLGRLRYNPSDHVWRNNKGQGAVGRGLAPVHWDCHALWPGFRPPVRRTAATSALFETKNVGRASGPLEGNSVTVSSGFSCLEQNEVTGSVARRALVPMQAMPPLWICVLR